MTIYEILNQTTEGTVFTTPKDIRPEVELALQDQFGDHESQWDEVKEKFGIECYASIAEAVEESN